MAFLINDAIKLATIPLSNFTANGSLGTAANTVDLASSFGITQTTAGISLTLPTPTDAQAGDTLYISNVAASTTSITIAGNVVPIGGLIVFMWTGASWTTNIVGLRNQGASISVASVPVGTLSVTHNLALPSSSFSNIICKIYNSVGSEIILKRNKVGDTTNIASFSIPVAITTNLPLVFDIVPLA